MTLAHTQRLHNAVTHDPTGQIPVRISREDFMFKAMQKSTPTDSAEKLCQLVEKVLEESLDKVSHTRSNEETAPTDNEGKRINSLARARSALLCTFLTA